jgi:acetate kinase
MSKKIIIINSGSSSIKFKIFDYDNTHILAYGIAERIKVDGMFSLFIQEKKITHQVDFPNHDTAIEYL